MESQPQNPEFRNNPKNFDPCKYDFARPKRILLFSVSARLLSNSNKNLNNDLDFYHKLFRIFASAPLQTKKIIFAAQCQESL